MLQSDSVNDLIRLSLLGVDLKFIAKTWSNLMQLFPRPSPWGLPQLLFLDQIKLLNENMRTRHANQVVTNLGLNYFQV
jgi:hypothetical protein